MKYRAEIDGLRALAILPVVGFHAGLSSLSGGFTGVDVFFVISGFLITGIIVDELREGRFSLLTFYQRRALRILPALGLVLAATTIAAYALMLPNEFTATGRSIVATLLFVSNILFWREAGYFESAAQLQPLLHTWSLAVEEQFYLVFPLFLLACARWFHGRWRPAILLVAGASFLLAVIATPRAPSASFFLLPTRAWELGLGALVAVGGAPRLAPGWARGLASLLGVGLIAWGVFALSEDDPFPGWNALFPCAGAALVIAYGAGTRVGGLLAAAPLSFVGRISYSLYLWHWPVIVFYGMVFGQKLTPAGTATVIALSFGLAVLTYHLVEMPFRAPAFRAMPAVRVLRGAVAGMAAGLVVGGLVAGMGGAWRTYPPDVLRIAGYTGYFGSAEHRYQFGAGDHCSTSGYGEDASFDRTGCLGVAPDRPDYLVIGDSHANAVWRAITLAFPDVNFMRASVSGCRPVLDADGTEACREINNYVLRDFLGGRRIDGVILAGRWRETDFPEVEATLAYLKERVGHVVVLGPTVEYEGEFPLLLARERLNDADGATENAIRPDRKALSDRLGRIVRAEGVDYVSVYDALCPGGRCIEATPEGVPLQFDYGHLTLAGSRLLIERIGPQLGIRS